MDDAPRMSVDCRSVRVQGLQRHPPAEAPIAGEVDLPLHYVRTC